MRNVRLAGLLLIVFVFGLTWAVSGKEAVDEICIPMEPFLLEPSEGATEKYPPVEFPHSRHFDFSCKMCHHEWDYETPVSTCAASECHDLLEPPKKADKENADNYFPSRYYKDAFHNTCMVCHKIITLKNIETENKLRFTDKNTVIMNVGPLTCKGCHAPE